MIYYIHSIRKLQKAVLLLVAGVLSGSSITAQIVGGNMFLQGNYVELGIAPNGAFGTTVNAPAGYHARPDPQSSSIYDPGTGTTNTLDSMIGFVADPDKDGWTVGTNPYVGDYFVPGFPQEGYSLAKGSFLQTDAWLSNYTNVGTTGFVGNGGLTGTNISYTNTATQVLGVWQGNMGNLQLRQTTRLRKDKLYFTVFITLINQGSTAIDSVFYVRTVDPDNEVGITGDFTTKNIIDYQLPNTEGKTLVSTSGLSVANAYLGLGTKDCRAKAFIITNNVGFPLNPNDPAPIVYNQTSNGGGYMYGQNDSSSQDVGVGVVYNIGTIPAGDSTTFAYAYVLNKADLDEALDATLPQFYVDTSTFTNGDTITYVGCGIIDTANLVINNSTGYTWTWTPTFGLSDSTGDSVSVVYPNSPITYYAIGTAPCGVDTITITFNPINGVPAPTVTTPVQYCVGDTPVQLTATGTATLQWWTTPAGGTPLPQAPTPGTAVADTMIWYVSQLDSGGCESARVPVVVYVYAFPAAPQVTSPTYFCIGAAATLNVPGSNLLWYPSASGGTGSAIAPVPNTSAADTQVYYVSQSNGNCEGPRASITVIVSPQPAAPVTDPNGPYCQYLPATALSATGSNLLWYYSSGGNGSPTAIIPGTTASGTTTYFVTQTVDGCESQQSSIAVQVLPGLPAPMVISPVNYCQGSPVPTIQAFGTMLTWYTTPAGGTGSTTTPVVDSANTGTTTWYVTQTYTNGCESPRAAIVVNVYPHPLPPAVVSPVIYCQYDTAVFLQATGQNLLWYTVPVGGFGSAGPVLPNTIAPDTLNYYVTQTINGCESDRAEQLVVVRFLPTADIIPSLLSACEGDTVYYSYSGNATASQQYAWAVSPGAGTAIYGSGQEVGISYTTPGTYTVQVQVANYTCLSPVATVSTVIHPIPQLTFISKDDACVGETVTVAMNYASDPIATYSWDLDGGTQVFGGSPFGVLWSAPGTYVVSAVASARGCSSEPVPDTITVHALPDANIHIINSSDLYCTNDTILLTAVATGYPLYQWTPEQAVTGPTDSAFAIARMAQSGYIRLVVTDTFSCTAEDSVFINTQPCCEAVMPTAFSPNGDGRNDEFRAVTVGYHQVIAFRVLNRWGQVVFSSTDDRHGWDGTLNGIPQDMGVYYYYLKYRCSNGQEVEKQGDVTLLR